MKVISISL